MADRAPEDIPELAGRAEIESPAELAGRIDKLQAAADDAAGQVRNLYIAFLSFGLYLAITVGATTDEQLLRESPVRLPIVDVGLPLVAFYWIAPLLFVLFHFNLLMQLYLLSEKLHRLDAAIRRLPDDAQRERRATLSQFVFSQILIGIHRGPVIRLLLNLVGWTTFVILPIAVLLLTQIQFLPYHDLLTTWWQRCLLMLDLLLLWVLWIRAIEPTGRLFRLVRRVVRWLGRCVLRGLAKPLSWPAWAVIGLRSLVRAVPTLPARIRHRLCGDPKRDWRVLRLQELSAISVLIALLIATIPGEFLAWPIDRLTDHGNIGVLNRNLSLREKQLVLLLPEPGLIENIGEEEALEKYTRGLDLRGRDLRYADLEYADLRKADLREGASLQGAYLWGADLRGADLWRADLQGAILGGADLKGAHLRGANLQDAVLPEANVQGAVLVGANLQGADLRAANVQGANLKVANLQGADLQNANLQGTDFRRADAQGAILAGAELQGADLRRASLQAASLTGANLQGAVLDGANLEGADLRVAHLWRATIGDDSDRDPRWVLADLRGADIEPVDVNSLINEIEVSITDEPTRTEVLGRLERTLRDGQRTPSWQGQPEVMFRERDQIPRARGWTAPTMTEADYDEKLATFLGNLACGDDGSAALAQGLARRATLVASLLLEPDRLLYQRLAQRLTRDDSEACPSAAELPEALRATLELLAAPLDSPSADQAEPAPAPPDTPLQEPGTSSQEPQTSRCDE